MKRFRFELTESVRIAIEQVRSNKLRSALTALGVVIGILAVTLMGTAVLALRGGIAEVLATMGSDSVFVTKQPWTFGKVDWDDVKQREPIRPWQSVKLDELTRDQPWGLIKASTFEQVEGYPIRRGDTWLWMVRIHGVEPDYAALQNVELAQGRFFNDAEEQALAPVVVLGDAVAAGLFPGENPLGQRVVVRRKLMTVIGVLKKNGGWMSTQLDSKVMMPLQVYYQVFGRKRGMSSIVVKIDETRRAEAMEELRAVVRHVRDVAPGEPDDFSINDSSTIMASFDGVTQKIVLAGFFITGLSLFVGAIGIMNITYVSVKERTQEIGTRKAIGARRRTILMQFLVEAVSICLLGGLIGLGLTFGLTVLAQAALPNFPITFSPVLVAAGLLVSVATGVVSGFAPALQASKLDPVTALRYE